MKRIGIIASLSTFFGMTTDELAKEYSRTEAFEQQRRIKEKEEFETHIAALKATEYSPIPEKHTWKKQSSNGSKFIPRTNKNT